MRQTEFMNLKIGDFVRMGDKGSIYSVRYIGTVRLCGAFGPVERDVHITYKRSGSLGGHTIEVAEGDSATIGLLQVVAKAPPEFYAFMKEI